MPNMFSGDQFHPAYDPVEGTRVDKSDNECLVDNVHYTIYKDRLHVVAEDVTGRKWSCLVTSAPKEVQDKWRKISKASLLSVDIKKLKNLKMKWRRNATREDKWRAHWTNSLSIEKSYGMSLAYREAARDLEELIKALSE